MRVKNKIKVDDGDGGSDLRYTNDVGMNRRKCTNGITSPNQWDK